MCYHLAMLRHLVPNAWFGALVVISSLGLISSLAVISSCSRNSNEAESSTEAAQYQVRGQVKLLPTDLNEIEIHHEAMPDFVNQRGKKSGMVAMVMPFAVEEGLSLAGIEVGDIVAFTLAVHWNHKPALKITAIEKLPADTELSL